MPVVPKKQDTDGEGRTRSIWASDALWEEIQLAAKREGYSVSKFVGFLLKGGLAAYQLERANEASKSAPDAKG